MSARGTVKTDGKVQQIDALEERDLLKLVFVSLQDIIAIEQAQLPVGEKLNMTVTVTGTPTFLNRSYVLTNGDLWFGPWVRFDLFNGGPDGVYYSVNDPFDRSALATIDKGEQISEDFRTRKIENVTLWCATGKTATVRLFFKR